MEMRKIMNEWKKFAEAKTYKRIVLNELTSLTEEEVKAFPLSDEELEILRRWGGLEGEPHFLGSGTMGSAFQFGDKVLKVTSDSAEANAAGLIKGLVHPHVYTIREVGLRQPQFKEMPNQRLAIVYDLVSSPKDGGELPDKVAQEVIKSIHNTSEKAKYAQPENFKELISKLIETAQQHSEVFNPEQPDNRKKVEKLMQLAGFGYNEKPAVMLSVQFMLGFYGKCYDTADTFISCVNNKEKEFDYYDQVCSGLTFLAQHGIFFGDLKTTNVLREDDRLIIIDVGKSMVRGFYDIQEIK